MIQFKRLGHKMNNNINIPENQGSEKKNYLLAMITKLL